MTDQKDESSHNLPMGCSEAVDALPEAERSEFDAVTRAAGMNCEYSAEREVRLLNYAMFHVVKVKNITTGAALIYNGDFHPDHREYWVRRFAADLADGLI